MDNLRFYVSGDMFYMGDQFNVGPGPLVPGTGGSHLYYDGITWSLRGPLHADDINASNFTAQTINIAGNAVTVPVVATAAGPLIGTNICSLVVPSSVFSIPYLLTVSFKAYTGSNNFGVTPTLKRDGVTVYAPGQLLGFSLNSPYANQICFVVLDTPSAGASHTYTLDILDTPGSSGNTGVKAYSIVLTAVGSKR